LLRTPAGPAIKRVVLEELAGEPWPDNLDVLSLEGKGTWLRVRVGAFRIVLRPLNAAECKARNRKKRGTSSIASSTGVTSNASSRRIARPPSGA
jgi:hypothetical protein